MKVFLISSAQRLRGFTLSELMVTVLIVGIIAGLSAPSLVRFTHSAHLKADSHALQASLAQSRLLAVNRSTVIEICAKAAPEHLECARGTSANTQWRNGWIVYEDNNQDGSVQPNEVISVSPARRHTNLRFNQRGRIRFYPDGTSRSAGFYLCSPRLKEARHIALLHSGRLRITSRLSPHRRQQCLAS